MGRPLVDCRFRSAAQAALPWRHSPENDRSMCGIAGFWGAFSSERLTAMSASIAHRGPDDSDVFLDSDASVGLAHRRLSIIDLSPSGHQPMWDSRGAAVIVYNGEVYNYRELRAGLEAQGFVFRGSSDTEVILALYMHLGTGMLERLNGIFAFAIWDTQKRELFLARDGLGIKPLYFSETPQGFLFASELKALLQEPAVPRAIDPVAVAQYATFMYCPAPRTMLAGVKKLEPGAAMLLRDRRIVRHWSYYQLPYGASKSALSTEGAVEAVRAAVKTAVDRQMVADVPVGAFLSGGLDSSSVVAFARASSKERLQCFTIETTGDAVDPDGFASDLPYAREVAAHLDVDLSVVSVGPEMASKLEEMIYFLDEPQGDPAPLNALFISRLAREHGIKVLLSGAGGDDIFTGYRRHYALMTERYWSWLPRPARQGLRAATGMLPLGSAQLRRVRRAFEYADLDDDARIASYFTWLNPAVVQGLLAPDLRAQVAPEAITAPLTAAAGALPAGTSALDRMLYLDTRYFLADHNLNYTDKMGMATGVEVRVPLLDPDLVALAASLPDRLKQNGTTGKWVFKKAMERDLPLDVIYRPKTGFGAPLRRWMRNELRPLVDDVLSARAIDSRGLFDSRAVSALVEADRNGLVDAAYPLFALACIETWCRLFVDQPVPQRPT
jgi:asparagine synthase (glutamine-hydrolysing)